jgi:hypothetical protein
MAGQSSLGRLVAAVALDTAEFIQGADKARVTAASLANDVDRQFSGLQRKVASAMGGVAAALAGGFAIKNLKDQFDSYAEGAAKLDDLASKAGTSIEKLSALVNVAKLSKTSADDLAGALAKLSRGVVNATGDTQGAGKALSFLGISATDANGRLKDSATLTEEIALKLATMQDGVAKTAIVMDLFGKSGANLIPVLKDIAEYGVQNATITQQQAKAAKEYEDDLVRLGMAKSALVRIISSELLPVGDAVVKTLLAWQTQTGGVRDKAQELAQDGSIRAFAMSVLNAFGLVLNAGDSVVRIFDSVGQYIGSLLARAGNAFNSFMQANLDYIQGNYAKAWADVANGVARDTEISQDAANTIRGIFEKPLAGDKFVAGVEQNLTALDAKMKEHGTTVKQTADGYKALNQASDDQADAATSLSDSLGRQDAKLHAELDSLVKYGVATKETSLATAEFAIANGRVAAALAELAKKSPDAARALKDFILQKAADIDATKLQIESETKYLEAVKQLNAEMANAVQSTVDQVKNEKDKIATFGMSTAQITLYTVAQLEAKKAQLEMTEGAEDQVKALQQQIDHLKQLAGLQTTYQDLQAQSKLWDDLAGKAGQFFGDLVVNGKSAFDQLKSSFRSFAADLLSFFAKQFILRVIATGATGTVTGAAASAAANGASNSITGTLVNAAGSYIGSTAIGATVGGFYAGAASAASEAAIGASFVGPSASLASGAVGAGAEAYGALSGVLGSIPVYGWIALAVIAIAAWLGGRGGGPKTGGSFMGAFDSSGNLTGSVPVPGSDNGRFYTPDQGDDQLKPLVQGVSSGVQSALQRFGGSSAGFHFGLGFDNDPNGTAQSRVSAIATDASGRVIYHTQDRSMDDKDVPAALQLEASRMVLAALQNSQLPDYLAKVFKGIDATTATQEQINSLLQTADALKTIFDVASRDPLADLQQVMTDSQNQLAAATRNNEAAIRAAMKAYDGSTTSAQNLQQATVAYYNAQIQLLAGIEQTKQAIGDMFGNTVRNFKLAGLDNQGKYNFYQNEAASLQQQILNSSDPATIQALSQRLDQDMEAAFNLLTPEQQAGAEGQSFISRAESTDQAIQDHLDDVKKSVLDPMKQTLEDLKALIGASDDAQAAAANTQQAAANTNLAAAQTPRTVVVTLPDGSQQVTTFDG